MKRFLRIIQLMFALPILIIMGQAFENATPIAGSLRRVFTIEGAPTSGTSGTYAGTALPGDLLVDTTNGVTYVNKNTQASPSWCPVPAPQVTQKTASDQTVEPSEAGVLEASDGIYLYLPTYVGFKGLTYQVKCNAAFSAGVKVYPLLNGTEKIDGATVKTSTGQYDCLTVIAGMQGWNIAAKVGTWN